LTTIPITQTCSPYTVTITAPTTSASSSPGTRSSGGSAAYESGENNNSNGQSETPSASLWAIIPGVLAGVAAIGTGSYKVIQRRRSRVFPSLESVATTDNYQASQESIAMPPSTRVESVAPTIRRN
jgi:hypothetical protein